MLDNSVVSKIKELRKDLDKETSLLQQQMELPLNSKTERNTQAENNSIQLSKGIAISKWVRKITSQFESVDPFYKETLICRRLSCILLPAPFDQGAGNTNHYQRTSDPHCNGKLLLKKNYACRN